MKWTRFEPRITNEFDIVYLIDAAGSMGATIQAAKDIVISIDNDLKNNLVKLISNLVAYFTEILLIL